jgi:2-polyprenyl-3-methyl-5-hydroxy-6-metoxy-1,4-benzoquinol methylase
MYKIIKRCRICSNKNLNSVIDLGKQPPANSLQKKILKQTQIPLNVVRCSKCTTLQLNATVNPKYLFSKYLWVTGTSDGVKKYRDFFIKKIKSKHKIGKSVLEVASNDGFFLKELKKNKYKVLGVDPAKNIARKANKNGIKTLPLFFNKINALKIKKNYFSPDIIICRNVIPHVENINSVIGGISTILNKNGKAYIEFHYAENLSKNLHYDYIYHEHIFYFTYFSIKKLLNKHKLYPIDYFNSPISGGSIVLEISRNKIKESKELKKLRKKEEDTKINTLSYWNNFSRKCLLHKKTLLKKINDNKIGNIAGYGASARSSTLLNFCKINNDYLKVIFDKNSLKHKLYTAGSNIQIMSPTKKMIKKFRCILILAWNFEKEIIRFIKKSGFKGKLIVVLPKIKILNVN